MPYQHNSELPEQVAGVLPAHAQEIYRKAFNDAYNRYDDPEDRRSDAGREETAHKVAWSAVKKSYAKGADDRWHRK